MLHICPIQNPQSFILLRMGAVAALLVRPCEVVAAPLRHSSPWVPCLGEGEGGRTAVAFRTCLRLRTG